MILKNMFVSICHKRNTLCISSFYTFLNDDFNFELLNKYFNNGIDGFFINNPMLIDIIKNLFIEKNIIQSS